MKNNYRTIIFASLAFSLGAYGSMTQDQAAFLSAYNAVELRSFCGNSPGASGDSLLTQYGISNRQMGLLLVEQIQDCLRVGVPRPASTNKVCALSLLKLSKFRVAEVMPVAQSAFLDSSDAFRAEALRAFFSCVSNVDDVVDFTSNVWSDVSTHAASRRLDCAIALKRWLPTRTELSVAERQTLYAGLAIRSQYENCFPVAMRLDQVMKSLNAEYLTSSVRTNLVLRFKDNVSAPNDPQYFHRQAEEMGIAQ